MDSYEINRDTCAVVGINEEITKIVEKDEEYLVNKTGYQIMEDSCKYYGSTYDGRVKGTKEILGSNYKVPVIVEESNEIVFFPTDTISKVNCVWISLNNIKKFEKCNSYTKVTFTSGKELYLKVAPSSFEMQMLRANRLNSIVKQRRNA